MSELTEITSVDLIVHLEWMRSVMINAPITEADKTRFDFIMERQRKRALLPNTATICVATGLEESIDPSVKSLVRAAHLRNEGVWERDCARRAELASLFGNRYFEYGWKTKLFHEPFQELFRQRGLLFNRYNLAVDGMGEWTDKCLAGILKNAGCAFGLNDDEPQIIEALSLSYAADPYNNPETGLYIG